MSNIFQGSSQSNVNARVSSVNSTAVPLTGASTFTGEWQEVAEYATLSVIFSTDVAGVTDGLELQLSTDATTATRIKKITPVLSGSVYAGVHELAIVSRYFRVVYTNGPGTQSTFTLQTIFSKVRNKHLTSTLSQVISDSDDVELTRSVIMGKTEGGYYGNVGMAPVTNAIQIDTPRTAFGEQVFAEPTPVIQTDFIANINTDIVNVTEVNGTVTQSQAMAVVQTSAAINSSAEIATIRTLKYRVGQGAQARYTALFTTGVVGSDQIVGIFDVDNGFAFGYNGSNFGLLRRSGAVDTWVTQANWNGDKMDGTGGATNPTSQLLDPTKGNVFQIQFQWLGFGIAAYYYIEDSATGDFVLVHKGAYANLFTVPSLLNPSFPMCAQAVNTTNSTNLTVKTSSMSAYIEGKIRLLGPRKSFENGKTGISTTLTNIITIRNDTTFAGIPNKVVVHVSKYSAAIDGTKIGHFHVILNATLGGTPSWTQINANTSVVSTDVAGTTVTGGIEIDGEVLGKTATVSVVPQSEDVLLQPGDTLTLAIHTTSGTTDASCFVRWIEDF